ncbi:MAG TPA: FAD-dependent oxidoreductase [Candidatus Limnocylindria bacterium]|nr:FAD-dependent oxidoreductase [Candidatus Limnocylindria bacterium]
MYDVIVIGAGPAGLAAGLTAAKNKLKTLVLAKEISVVPEDDGLNLLDFKQLQKELKKLQKEKPEFLEQMEKQEVTSLEKNIVSFSVEVKSGQNFYCSTVIIASGPKQAEFDLLTYKDFNGKIKVDEHMQTNIAGIFAAGQATTTESKEVFVIAGEGAKAALSAKRFLKKPR